MICVVSRESAPKTTMHLIVRLRVKYINQFLHGYLGRQVCWVETMNEWRAGKKPTRWIDSIVGWCPSVRLSSYGHPLHMQIAAIPACDVPQQTKYHIPSSSLDAVTIWKRAAPLRPFFEFENPCLLLFFDCERNSSRAHYWNAEFETNCKRFRDVVRREKNKNSKLCKRCVIVFENTILLLLLSAAAARQMRRVKTVWEARTSHTSRV